MSEIDPVEFGEMRAAVATLSKEVDELRTDVKTLLEVANRGRGALWLALTVGGMVGSIAALGAKYLAR